MSDPAKLMPPEGVDLLKLEEVGYLLGRVSSRTVRRLIDQGKLRRTDVTPGGAIRVRREEVNRYIADNTYAERPDREDPAESPGEAAARREADRAKVKATWNDGSDPFAPRSRGRKPAR